MKQNIIAALVALAFYFATIGVTTALGRTDTAPSQLTQNRSGSGVESLNRAIPETCALQPEQNPALRSVSATVPLGEITLERFRHDDSHLSLTESNSSSTKTLANYKPRETIALANPTNYGQRFVLDLYAKKVDNEPIVVLHETVFSAQSAINTFRTYNRREADQVSYHTLIKLNGDIVYLVPPDLRAYGAGNSVFQGEKGIETVKTHPQYPPSVNNFAYHVSLETPANGRNNRRRHSGYTQAQYRSLAWLVAKTGVPNSRITTHKAVDRSGSRGDPRSFNTSTFLRFLNSFPKTKEINIGCQLPSNPTPTGNAK
jgi:N-acetyl-anhydromuramyl-L-alanine amidase AmpD